MAWGVVSRMHEHDLPIEFMEPPERVDLMCDRFRATWSPRRKYGQPPGKPSFLFQGFGHESIKSDDGMSSLQDLSVEPFHGSDREGPGLHTSQAEDLVGIDIHDPVDNRQTSKHGNGQRNQGAHGGGSADKDRANPSTEQPVKKGLEKEADLTHQSGLRLIFCRRILVELFG